MFPHECSITPLCDTHTKKVEEKSGRENEVVNKKHEWEGGMARRKWREGELAFV